MWSILLAIAIGASLQAEGACACLCMDGQATTLCQTIEQASAGPNLCSLAQHCPQTLAEHSEVILPPPNAGVHRCRVALVWDRQHQAQRSINVCDLLEPDG